VLPHEGDDACGRVVASEGDGDRGHRFKG
jgi:hypothetical protein